MESATNDDKWCNGSIFLLLYEYAKFQSSSASGREREFLKEKREAILMLISILSSRNIINMHQHYLMYQIY